ncbi:hypothetical protein H70357_24615 [Paenibacillus sp. FSL H7-0357]|uniref:hypothetical protein n=1 Tax=Paenibacillus sp. FSL H7-0357 TaxID=1536774 RepID=UPI0004F8C0A0|nr:hypothetical protein [Paenibacillus sp. FSL H7-0357]AIQ19542.1 hypothetical protein H70357_24615 [Paenibacillus sp. FSL H7-0357]
MINWIKYPENEPERNKVYLVYGNGKLASAELDEVDAGRFMWYTPNGYIADRITHYAHINLPGEETDNA